MKTISPEPRWWDSVPWCSARCPAFRPMDGWDECISQASETKAELWTCLPTVRRQSRTILWGKRALYALAALSLILVLLS